jgi:hypothetical protein
MQIIAAIALQCINIIYKYLLSAAETLQHNWGIITDAICHFSQLKTWDAV